MDSTRVAGTLMVLLPIAFNAFFFLLQRTFEYPDILRRPTDYVLDRFQKGGQRLVAIWYGFMLTAVLFAPLAVLVHQVLKGDEIPYMRVGTTIGVLAGVVQFLGLARWPFLVPYLASAYHDRASGQATRAAVDVTFQTFNRFAGVAIGEHLGYLFTSIWTAFVGLAMTRSPLFSPWLGWIGFIPAVGIFVGVLEGFGFRAAGTITAIAYILWSVWLIVTGVTLMLR